MHIRKIVTETMLAQAILRPKMRFAFWPTRLHDGSWIWLEYYFRAPIGLYVEQCNGVISLRQYRSGLGWDDEEYFPHRNFRSDDTSYFKVDYAEEHGIHTIQFLLEKAGEVHVQV